MLDDILKLSMIVVMICICVFGGIYVVTHLFQKDQISQQELIDQQNREFKRIAEDVVRAQTEVNEKKFKEEYEKIDSRIQELVKKSDELPLQVGTMIARSKQTVHLNEPSSREAKLPEKDINYYVFKKVYGKDTEGKEYPIGWVQYYPNRSKDKQWKSGTYPLDINVRVTQTKQKSGTINNYIEVWAENQQMEETRGKEYPLQLVKAGFVQIDPNKKTFMFKPVLDVGITGDSRGRVGGSVNLSFFGYGKTEKELDWRFPSVGVTVGSELKDGNSSGVFFQVYPFQYRVGKHIPMLDNLYIGPAITVDLEGKIGFGGGLSVRF